jgi:aspartate ammonia-lyase
MRKEKDFLGEVSLPKDVLYGIHSYRACDNFSGRDIFQVEWYQAVGMVKLACYQTYADFKSLALREYSEEDIPITFMDDAVIQAMEEAASKVMKADYFEHFIIPAMQGGAGTSINMAVNEIISNAALINLGRQPGEYQLIDPIENANIYQSTNDVVPTALKIALMLLLKKLEEAVNNNRQSMEQLERKYGYVLRLAYTQLQEAVPSTYGRLFAAYSDALSRDWWRISKCWERIKVVNIGGGAIGTGLSVPRYFIMEVVKKLKDISCLPISRGENMGDVTSNMDSFVEVSAILKAHAVNLEKIANDLRMLSADISKTSLKIPRMQLGSSIMPAKVNPVIPEFIISICHKIYANDQLISSLASRSDLELNAYLPTIGHALLENVQLLISADRSLKEKVLNGIEIDATHSEEAVYHSPAVCTALSPYIGYNKAAKMAQLMKEKSLSIFEANEELKALDMLQLQQLMKPEKLTQLGFSIKDLL